MFFEATSAHISKIKQVLVPWTSSRPSRSVTLGLIGPVWGVIGRRKDILNSRVVDPMPRLRVEWIARPILDRASLPQAHHERSQQGLGGLFRVRCRIGLDLISAIAAADDKASLGHLTRHNRNGDTEIFSGNPPARCPLSNLPRTTSRTFRRREPSVNMAKSRQAVPNAMIPEDSQNHD